MAIYAIDFDGTLANTQYPKIVEPNKKVVAYAKMLKIQGHKLILWTCRQGQTLEEAVEWCTSQGLEFDAVNEHLPEQIERWGNDTRKIYADYYIDDKAVTVEDVESMTDEIVGTAVYAYSDSTDETVQEPMNELMDRFCSCARAINAVFGR